MPKLVSDGGKRFVAANEAALRKRYELRVAEIKSEYKLPEEAGILKRWARYLVMRGELVRAKREIYGSDKLYLLETA